MPLLLLAIACAQPPRDRAWVDDEIERRLDASAGQADDSSKVIVSEADGLDEREAVALALQNSPQFAVDMTTLMRSTADFKEAARVRNPTVSLMGPVGNITAAATVVMPLMDAFRLPKRTKMAGKELEAVTESLVQTGLDLARDVRVAHTDSLLAKERRTILLDLAGIAADFADIADARAAAGDTSPADALAVRADSYVVEEEAAAAARQQVVAEGRLMLLLGQPWRDGVQLNRTVALETGDLGDGDLVRIAQESRPDVHALEFQLQAAGARAGWEKSRVVELAVAANFQWDDSGSGARLGALAEIPLFNQNQGGVGRAEADIEQALQALRAARLRVAHEVLSASADFRQARASLERYEKEVLPPLAGSLEAATQRYELGDDSYLVVLDALRRSGRARLQMSELRAQAHRAHAELERAVGARLDLLKEEKK